MPNLFLGFPVSRAAFAEVAGQAVVGNLPHSDLYYVTFFEADEGFGGVQANGGTWTIDFEKVHLNVIITANSRAQVNKEPSYMIIQGDFDKDRTWRGKCRITSDIDSTMEAWIGTGYVFSRECLGFFLEDGKIYARTSDNVGTTDVEIADNGTSGYDITHVFKIVFTAGVKAEFYIDGVLKATITTNLPSGTDEANLMFHLEIRNADGTDTGDLYCSHVDCFQKA